jgi:hypothetical protein
MPHVPGIFHGFMMAHRGTGVNKGSEMAAK